MNMQETMRRNIALYREYRAGKPDGLTQRALGERYGISQSNISRILRKGKAWAEFLEGIGMGEG
jgi:transcriptional regulator with XRE-family HTH domain